MPTSNITYMDGEQVISGINSTMQAVSGMTIAEAEAALGATGSPEGGAQIISFPMVQEEGGTTIPLQAAYASELWEYFKTAGVAGGVTTALGAAAAGARSWASGVFIGDASAAGSLAGTGALLSMSLPAVAAAAAPVLGVSLGNALYQSNPELWTAISQALLPFAYKDTEVIPAVVDENGQAYIDKRIIDALKAAFDAEGVPVFSENNDYTSEWFRGTAHAGSVIYTGYGMETKGAYGVAENTLSLVVASSVGGRIPWQPPTSPYYGGTFNESWTYDGKTVYLHRYSAADVNYIPTPPRSYLTFTSSLASAEKLLAWTIIYGTPETGEYPTGTSRWSGTKINPADVPTIDVVSGTGSTTPYFPVQLPVGDPTVSPDPAVQPNPISPSEIPSITPFVPPQVSPSSIPESLPEVEPDRLVAPQSENDPIYVPSPDLNPELDPAENVPTPELSDSSLPPQSGGQSPSILFPEPDTQWDSPIPSSGSGLIHVYNPTTSQFISFGNWLWVTYADPSIQKLWNNPFDGVISAHELYATPSKDGTDTIRSGFLDSGISSTIVRIRYTTINCGSVLIPEYYGNYLDYSPYSKAYIYLPFIGIVEVDVDDIVGHAVNICYHVDSYSGACIAQITVAKDNYENTVYQYSGNCSVELPLAGGSQAAIKGAMISAAAYGINSTLQGAVHGGMSGGIPGALVGGGLGIASGIAGGVANLANVKSTVQHSGSFGSSFGAMGIKKPYIIIRRPVEKQVINYNVDYGYPAHKRVIIGSCRGYLRVREVNVVSSLATAEEKVEIENFLKTGVFVTP